MQYRGINNQQALEALRILKEECGYQPSANDDHVFVHSILAPHPVYAHVCHEYRFIGAIGSGAKFRNNGNCDNTPYVDCYAENRTPERDAMIERANKRLAELFPTEGVTPLTELGIASVSDDRIRGLALALKALADKADMHVECADAVAEARAALRAFNATGAPRKP